MDEIATNLMNRSWYLLGHYVVMQATYLNLYIYQAFYQHDKIVGK